MDDLPDHFDLVVVGTGLTETILAAAASRAGRTVLQCDRKDYYGADWASFSLRQWEEWIEEQRSPTDSSAHYNPFSNVELVTHFTQSSMSYEKIRGLSGKFCIDLCPRLLFSKGSLVDLLVQSNISRYLEFKNCTRLMIKDVNTNKDEWFQVPCTRDAVFNDKQLSLVQKRKFMKFIDKCVGLTENDGEVTKLSDLPFDSFLRTCALDERLSAMVSATVIGNGTSESLSFLRRFIESSGRYGPTPFLWTLYGSGELPQAFARMSAVFGGVYCLNQEIQSLHSQPECLLISFEGKKQVTCKFVAGSVTSLTCDILSLSEEVRTSHAVCITNKSINDGDEQEITSARIPFNGLDVCLIEVGSGSMCVPPGFFLVYMSCKSLLATARHDLTTLVDLLFPITAEPQSDQNDCQTRVLLWSCFFNRKSPLQVACTVENVHVLKSASPNVDYESEIGEAKALFHKLFPEDAFLPRAPDAEDIIVEERDEGQAIKSDQPE